MALKPELTAFGEVSAQMVCLDDSQTIRRSVESLLRCGVKKIVVVDGGSSDGTLEQLSDLPVILMTSQPGIRAQTMVANTQMDSVFTVPLKLDNSRCIARNVLITSVRDHHTGDYDPFLTMEVLYH